jgi:hypothetical protein
MTECELRVAFGDQAVDALLTRIAGGQAPEVDPRIFGNQLHDAGIGVNVTSLLDAAVAAGIVERVKAWRCPNPTCNRTIDADAVANRICPHCDVDFAKEGDDPTEITVYRIDGELSRSVPWLIAVHGFNTRGTWQEEFSWRIANKFKYHAPVLIYKYGLVRVGVLFTWRHRMLARELGQRIRKAIVLAKQNQIKEPPDIIVHSFGSQLFRQLLELEEFSDLRFGRVIAVGSVIRPDFDWSFHIGNGRLEAVLNQCGALDWAVPFAQFTIPGTGPGGRHGFTDRAAKNVQNARYSHNSAFDETELQQNLMPGGLWDQFLREPISSFLHPAAFSPKPWAPAAWLFRLISRMTVIVLIAAGSLFFLLYGLSCLMDLW